MRARGLSDPAPGVRVATPGRVRLADLAVLAAAAAAFVLFGVSSLLLEKIGYHYETSGGFPWEKFHPATALVAGALVLRCMASPKPLAAASRIFARDPWLLLFLLAVAIAGAHATLVSRQPFTPLVDTFVLPTLILILYDGLDPRVGRLIALGVCAIMAANATIGLIEYLSGWRLLSLTAPEGVSADPTDPNAVFDWRAALALEWRATALLGHPLSNGLITGAFILCLASPGAGWLPPALRLPLLGLSLMAMSAFGARASLVLSGTGAVGFLLLASARRMAAGRGLDRRAVALFFFACPVAIAAVAVLVDVGFFDKLIQRFANDAGSANARIVMWDMFAPLPWRDIMTGPDPAVIATWQRLLGLEFGIESFWVGLPLQYGLVVSVILFLALAVFVWRVVAKTGSGAVVVMGYFFVVASTSTSLSSKTTGLAVVVLMTMLIIPAHKSE